MNIKIVSNTKIIKLLIALFSTLLLCLLMTIISKAADFSIITQPKDVTVSYPNAAIFNVEVDNPANVKSYQWQLFDGEAWYDICGLSGSTDTLNTGSTYPTNNGDEIRCVITDKNGTTVTSDSASITISNKNEEVPALYIVNYAITAGQSLDLSTTELGSGVISFDANGTDFTFDNVSLDNSKTIFDFVCGGVGLDFRTYANTNKNYAIHLIGDNILKNTFYQPESNGAGITLDFYYRGASSTKATLTIDGPGTLTIKGGTYNLRNNGDLVIATTVNLDEVNGIFSDGFVCKNFTLKSGVKSNVVANGSGISTSHGSIYFEPGSEMKMTSHAGHVSVGPIVKQAIFAYGDIYLDKATLDIDVDAKPDGYDYPNSYIATYQAINLVGDNDKLSAKDSKITINMTAAPSDDHYAESFNGIIGSDPGALAIELDNSTIDISIDSKSIVGASAVHVLGDVSLINNSRITADVNVSGIARGVVPEGKLIVKDSTIKATSKSLTNDESTAILCDSAEIDFTKDGYEVSGYSNGGIGFAALISTSKEDLEYDSSYKQSKTVLKNKAEVITPEKYAFNQFSLPLYDELTLLKANLKETEPRYLIENALIDELDEKPNYPIENALVNNLVGSTNGKYLNLEACYSLSDTTKPSSDVVIRSKEVPKTGDSDNAMLYIIFSLLGMSIIAIIIGKERMRSHID